MKIMRLLFVLTAFLLCFTLLFGCINKKDQPSTSKPENNFIYPSTEEIERANNGGNSLMIAEEDEMLATFNNTPSNIGEPLDFIGHNELMPPPPPD